MAINAGGVVATLELDASKFNQGLKTADGDMQGFVGKLDKVGGTMGKIGDKLTKRVTLPILGIGTAATMVGIDFESSMSEVQAISGATGSELEALEDKAREMGATTKFSASDAADALGFMAMAGWDSHQMLEGIDGVMQLAAASGEDLATVSDIVTDAITAFGLEAEDASVFADLLASTSSNANTNVGMLGESFKYVAPLFGSLGYSAEDSALALGLMADAGIKGGQAGTSLRSAVSRLIKPTGESAELIEKLGINMTDAEGNMIPFKDVMDQLRDTFGNLSEEQQAQYAATIFGQEAMSGMLAIINASDEDYEKLTQATRDYNGAAKEMSDIMQDNLQGDLERLKSGLQEAGIQIFETLLPHLETLVEKLQGAVTWFSNLDESTQETIIQVGLLAAAVGPVFALLSGGIGIVTTLAPLITGLGGAAGTAGGAAGMGALATGAGKLGGLAKLGPALLNPYTAAVAGIGIAGYGVYKTLNQEVIPEVDLFDDHVTISAENVVGRHGDIRNAVETTTVTISDATKEAVGAYLEMDEAVKFHTDSIYVNGTEITQDMKDEISRMYREMTSEIVTATEERKNEELAVIQGLFDESWKITETEQDNILSSVEGHYNQRKIVAETYEEEINAIYQRAADENRAITEDEQKQINRLQEGMKEQAVKILSDQEVEANIILERMKEYSTRVTAEQASEMIAELNRGRDEAIAAANESYDGQLEAIIRLRDEAKVITSEQADKMIEEAQRQRDGTVSEAERTRDEAVDAIFGMNSDLINNVDSSTGEIISFWDRMFGKWDKWTPSNKTATFTTIYKTQGNVMAGGGQQVYQAFARGTNFAPGGIALVGEEGPELVELPRGSKVKTAQETKNMLSGGDTYIIESVTIPAKDIKEMKDVAEFFGKVNQAARAGG